MSNADVELFSMNPQGIMPDTVDPQEVLSYVIAFQNPLGTRAYDVTIIDTLPKELDFSTISWPFSSYPEYELSISNEGVLRFELEGINLTDAEEDELNTMLSEAGFTIAAVRRGSEKGMAGTDDPFIILRAHG